MPSKQRQAIVHTVSYIVSDTSLHLVARSEVERTIATPVKNTGVQFEHS